MSTHTTPFISQNLKLPYIAPAQAQKHVTVNESLRILDAVVQLSVFDKDLTTPPTAPSDGDRYIVAAGGTGDWAGADFKIAAYQDGAWAIIAPSEGWVSYVVDEGIQYIFNGTSWIDYLGAVLGDLDADTVDGIDSTGFFRLASASTQSASGNLQILKSNPTIDIVRNAAMAGAPTVQLRTNGRYDRIQNTSSGLSFGVNFSGTEKVVLWNGTDLKINGQHTYHVGNIATGTDNARFGELGVGGATADATNVLALNGSAALFNNNGAGIQIKLNKNATADTASFLFQNGFGGRAEIGLTGDDDFHFKVSPDGSTFYDAIIIDKDNGNVGIGIPTPSTKLHVDGPIRCKSYTVATVPSAASSGAGASIYVSNETGGGVLAFSDGTNWLRCTDRAVIS
ncbi:MAG: DUF2793 domain-containing protein [Robiginitomaculum sp.]|nr:DUF2793 domain-containing protein [Robiginitomaculum sp.]